MLTLRSAALAGAALTLLFTASLPASAEERVCSGSLGAITVDNLVVPQRATCRLDRTRVTGNIFVRRAATLIAARIVVIGNIQADNPKFVAVRNGSRARLVQVKQGGGATVVDECLVDGVLRLVSNSAALRVLNNTVGADVQAFQNRGGAEISDNRIDGNLQCKANVPARIGGGNIVQGNEEDQCRLL